MKVEHDNKSLYIDGKLYHDLKEIKKILVKKDMDYVLAIDGAEGSGKSELAKHIAWVVDPTINLSRICMTPLEFRRAIVDAGKGEAVIYDEAFTGLSSRQSLSEVNKMLVELMMEMRQKNLFVIVCLPTFFMLDRYVALFRARCLLHTYFKGTNRGYWVMYNRLKKKLLYLKGKKTYSYGVVKSRVHGRFLRNVSIIDDEAYREKKKMALHKKDRRTRAEQWQAQRNMLLWILHKEFNLAKRTIDKLCEQYKVGLKESRIGEILHNVAKKKDVDGL